VRRQRLLAWYFGCARSERFLLDLQRQAQRFAFRLARAVGQFLEVTDVCWRALVRADQPCLSSKRTYLCLA
jgi:hypothetical protein